ncbi:reverse transcriptase [Lasius niger]|uniref:Reverse transcriptase n=1 Tax=Lasius niger TaxID=67767 RepID=A0A0J7MR83_LASNI|nr:reverse transcriptase [Lasius niger]
MVELVAYAKERGLDLLLGCDANSHHLVWGSTNINPRGESLFNFVMSAELHILNRRTEPTFLDSRRQEVLDITLCTEGVVDLVKGWRVSSEPSGSDHSQIRFALGHIQKEEKWGRNPRKINWENFRTDLKRHLKNALTRFHTKDDLEVAVDFMCDAIRNSYEMNCPLELKNASVKVSW